MRQEGWVKYFSVSGLIRVSDKRRREKTKNFCRGSEIFFVHWSSHEIDDRTKLSYDGHFYDTKYTFRFPNFPKSFVSPCASSMLGMVYLSFSFPSLRSLCLTLTSLSSASFLASSNSQQFEGKSFRSNKTEICPCHFWTRWRTEAMQSEAKRNLVESRIQFSRANTCPPVWHPRHRVLSYLNSSYILLRICICMPMDPNALEGMRGLFIFFSTYFCYVPL